MICKDSKTVERNFYKGDYDKIREELSVIDWNTMDEKNVEESWYFFINQISGCIEKHIPLKKVNLNRKRQRWVDTVWLASVKAKHKAWNRYVHTQDRSDYLKYCKARNQCTKVTRSSKEKFERSIINQSRTNGPINAHLTIAQVMPRYNHNNEKQEALP